MGAVVINTETCSRDPLVNEPRVSPGAQLIGAVNAAAKDELVETAATPLEPSQDRRPSWLKKFELDRSFRFFLNDHAPVANSAAGN